MSKEPLFRGGPKGLDREIAEQFGAFILFLGAFSLTILVHPNITNIYERIMWHLAQGTFGYLSGRMGHVMIKDLANPNERIIALDDLVLVQQPNKGWKAIRKGQTTSPNNSTKKEKQQPHATNPPIKEDISFHLPPTKQLSQRIHNWPDRSNGPHQNTNPN